MFISETFQQFDWALYGMIVRKRRVELGYKKAEHFAASVWRRVRFEISRDSLYKIEQGKQVPTGMQVIALNMALFGQPFPEELFEICASRGWKKIARDTRAAIGSEGDYESIDMTRFVPEQWKEVNYSTELLEKGYEEMIDDGTGACAVQILPPPNVRALANEVDDVPSLFMSN